MFKIIVVSISVLCFAGGAAARSHAKAPTPSLTAQPAKTYELGPGDKLSVIVFDEEQLTGTFYVGSNGAISMPWIGEVPASGRTEAELQEDIAARLKDGYILNPQVSVQVAAYRPFFILGEVNRPGQYPFVTGLTVRSAVAAAGCFTYRANTKKVFIKRSGQAVEFTLPLTSETQVEAGDTVRIAERYF